MRRLCLRIAKLVMFQMLRSPACPEDGSGRSRMGARYAAVAKARDQLDLRALDMTIASQGKGESLPLHELGVDFGPLFRCVQV